LKGNPVVSKIKNYRCVPEVNPSRRPHKDCSRSNVFDAASANWHSVLPARCGARQIPCPLRVLWPCCLTNHDGSTHHSVCTGAHASGAMPLHNS
jgi:hypothetical protein